MVLLFYETRKKMFNPEKSRKRGMSGIKLCSRIMERDEEEGTRRTGEPRKTGEKNYAKWGIYKAEDYSRSSINSISAFLVGSSVNLTLLTKEHRGNGLYLQMVRGTECSLMVDVICPQKSPIGTTRHPA